MENKNDQNKQKKEGLKTKKIRVVAVNPMAWEKIVSYVSDMPIAFGNAKRAAEIQDLLGMAQMMEVEVPDVEKDKPET